MSNLMLASRRKAALPGLEEPRMLSACCCRHVGVPSPSPMGSQTQPQRQFVTGENSTSRVPLTTSCRARPLVDTGSKHAHKAILQGSLLHLQMKRQLCPLCSIWRGRAWLAPGWDTSLPSGKKQIWRAEATARPKCFTVLLGEIKEASGRQFDPGSGV